MKKACAVLCGLVLVSLVGCGPKAKDYGPKVDQFTGKLVQDGKPVAFTPGSEPTLRVISKKDGDSFGIPIKADGTFSIGWMPIGEYVARLEKKEAGGKGGPPPMYTVPGGLKIEEGKTDYTIDLGKDFKA